MSLDRVSNMLSALKNAAMTGNEGIEVSYTKEIEGIANVLKEKGFLNEVKTFKPKDKPYKMLHLGLNYEDNVCTLSNIKRISKPGFRRYSGSSELKKVAGGYGIQIVSTSRGIMDSGTAKSKNLGGEILCEVF